MLHCREVLGADHITQPGSELLGSVVDLWCLHGKGMEKQNLVQIVSYTSTGLLPCSDGIVLVVCR